MANRKEVIREKFKDFCKTSTLHGFSYFYKSNRWTIHLLWILIIISSLILCTFLSQMIWQKFVIDPTFTVVESSRYSISEIPFPAVTICDTNVVYGPNTENITTILIRRGYSTDQAKSFFQSLTNVKNVSFMPEPYLIKMHSLLDDLGYPYRIIMDMVKKPCDILLMECIWRSKIFNCSDMFRSVHTFNGYCCQFDIPFFRDHVDPNEVTFTGGAEATEGLEVKFNGNYVAPDGQISEGTALLYLFDYKDSITMLDSFTTLTPKTFYDVNLDVWAIDSSENVKALSIKSRQCLLSSDNGADFYQGCLTTSILQKVVDSCRCLPFNYTASELQVVNYTRCSWDRLFCVYGTLDKVLADIRIIIVESGCYQRCDYVQYETKVKYIRQMNRLGKPDNSSRFVVHFGDNTCMKYRREVLYSWDQMLANLGGIFGLCLGGSLISIIELIWFLIDVAYTLIVPPKQVTPRKKSLQKDFAAKLSPAKFKSEFGSRKIAFVN